MGTGGRGTPEGSRYVAPDPPARSGPDDPGADPFDGRFLRWLAPRRPRWSGIAVTSVERAADGHSHETLVVTVEARRSSEQVFERLVVRIEPSERVVPGSTVGQESEILPRLAASGVPVPQPSWFVRAGVLSDREALVMPFVEGHVVGDAPGVDPWVVLCGPELRCTLHRNFASVLALIHRTDVAIAGDRVRPFVGLDAEVEWWRTAMLEDGDGPPVASLAGALDWCSAHVPDDVPDPSVLWGDVRLGNAVFGDDGTVRALLDWDMAGVGPAELDLGYLVALDRVAGRWGTGGADGFLDHDGVVAEWERAVGRKARRLEWYELFGLCRSIIVSNRLCRIARDAGRRFLLPDDESNPVLVHLVHRLRSEDGR